MLSKTKLIELTGLGVAAAMVTTVGPLVVGADIPPSQVAKAGMGFAAAGAVAVLVSKPQS